MTTIGFIEGNIPRIIVSELANTKMKLYINGIDNEIGWLGAIEKLESGDFYISDVFLLEQTVSAANTTITADGQSKFIMELIQNGRRDLLNKIKFWGHSHVNMPVSPSGQDEETLQQLKPDVDPDFFLRGIFNKRGEVKYTLFYYTHGIVIDDVKWELENIVDEDLIAAVTKEIKEKVIDNTPKIVVRGPYGKPYHPNNKQTVLDRLKNNFNGNVYNQKKSFNQMFPEDEIDDFEDDFEDEIDDFEDEDVIDHIPDSEWMDNLLKSDQ